jgi:hypothetical protein
MRRLPEQCRCDAQNPKLIAILIARRPFEWPASETRWPRIFRDGNQAGVRLTRLAMTPYGYAFNHA